MNNFEKKVKLLVSNNIKTQFSEEKLTTKEKEKAVESLFTILGGYMKDYGRMTKEMDEDMSCLAMVTPTKVNFKTAKQMEKEHISGEMVKFMMVNG